MTENQSRLTLENLNRDYKIKKLGYLKTRRNVRNEVRRGTLDAASSLATLENQVFARPLKVAVAPSTEKFHPSGKSGI
jgi:hypothetical protein